MKRLLSSTLIGLTLGLSLTSLSLPTKAQSNQKYSCGQLGGVYRTFARTERGNIAIIDWQPTSSDANSARQRCLEVSRRFQRFSDAGLLKYLTTGQVNNLPVICVARTKGAPCLNQDVLVTLKKGDNASIVLSQMLDLRRIASGTPMKLSEAVMDYVDRQPYVNLEKFLELAPSEESSVTPVE